MARPSDLILRPPPDDKSTWSFARENQMEGTGNLAVRLLIGVLLLAAPLQRSAPVLAAELSLQETAYQFKQIAKGLKQACSITPAPH